MTQALKLECHSAEFSIDPNASANRIFALPGFKDFCWLSWGAHPVSHKISNVATKRASSQ